VVKVGGFCFQTADQVEIDMRLSSRNTIIRSMIGIGGCLSASPLPHHRAYGSVPRRFD